MSDRCENGKQNTSFERMLITAKRALKHPLLARDRKMSTQAREPIKAKSLLSGEERNRRWWGRTLGNEDNR